MVLHVVDQARSGACPGGDGSCKFPVEGAPVRVFDRNELDGTTIDTLNNGDCSGPAVTLTKNPDGSLYDDIFECAPDHTLAAPFGCVTDADGFCIAGEETVGDFLVIVKYVDDDTGKTVYTGKPKSPDDFDATGLATKDFQVLKVIRRDGSVQFIAGSKTVVKGSFLEIVYPAYAVWEDAAEAYVYAFIFTSDSDWEADLCARMPEGYNITGVYDEDGNLVSDTSCAQTFVTGEAKVVAFEVEEVGSPEPVLGVLLRVEHEGMVTTLDIEVPGDRTYVDDLPSNLPTAGGVPGRETSPWWPVAMVGGLLALGLGGGIALWRGRRA